jgi:hypothetical protein
MYQESGKILEIVCYPCSCFSTCRIFCSKHGKCNPQSDGIKLSINYFCAYSRDKMWVIKHNHHSHPLMNKSRLWCFIINRSCFSTCRIFCSKHGKCNPQSKIYLVIISSIAIYRMQYVCSYKRGIVLLLKT